MIRERNRSDLTQVTQKATWWNVGPGYPPEPSPDLTVLYDQEGTSEHMRDTSTPSFDEISSRGGIVNTDMLNVKSTWQMGKGSFLFTKVWSPTFTQHGRLSDYGWLSRLELSEAAGHSLPGFDSLVTEVTTRALSTVTRPDFSGLVSMGELGETLRYLRDPLGATMRLASSFQDRVSRLYLIEQKRARSGRPLVKSGQKGLNRDDAAILRDLQGLYLEFRYGVRPLVREVTSFLENLREREIPRPKRQTFRSSQKQFDDTSWSSTGSAVGGGVLFDIDYYYKRDASVSVGMLYEYDTHMTLPERWGLELGQIPSAAWQLVSCSFIVDWFANVGQFVSAITPAAGMRRINAWTVTKTDELLVRSTGNYFIPSWDPHGTSGSRGSDSLRVKSYIRSRGVGLPGIVLKANASDTFSDLAKVLDLITITQSKLGGSMARAQGVATSVARRTGTSRPPHQWYG